MKGKYEEKEEDEKAERNGDRRGVSWGVETVMENTETKKKEKLKGKSSKTVQPSLKGERTGGKGRRKVEEYGGKKKWDCVGGGGSWIS